MTSPLEQQQQDREGLQEQGGAASPPLSHSSAAEPVPVSGKAGIANADPAHWGDSLEARYLAEEYAGKERGDLCMGDLSDFLLANRQYLASRTDLDLIVYQTAAKERIRWLSVQLALAKAGAA